MFQLLHTAPAVLLPGSPRHKSLGVQKIGVHQAGIEHSGEEHSVGLADASRRRGRFGKSKLLFPRSAGLQLPGCRPIHPGAKGALVRVIGSTAAVREAAVMSGYGKGGKGLSHIVARKGSGGGVVHPWSAPESALKGVRILPNVMGQSGQPPLFLRTKSGGKPGAKLRCPGKVFQNALFPPVLRNMRQIRLRVNPSSFLENTTYTVL